MTQDIDERLEKRLGRLHARLRLGIEADHEAQVFGQGINYFHIENLPPSHVAIRLCLKLTGLYGRGQRNATQIEVRRHDVISSRIPKAFDGYTILQLSDLHVEISEGAMIRLAFMLPDIAYDLCVLTGDYRAQTIGVYELALAGMARLCSTLKKPIFGVLGNHDTIRMVPQLEDMGIQMLLNENHAIERDHQRIYLAGIDDAHFYRVDNIEKAATGIPFRKLFDLVIAYAGGLSASVLCGLLLASQRAHPRWSNLPSRPHSNHFGFCSSPSYGFGRMEVPGHDWLHICRRRLLHRPCEI